MDNVGTLAKKDRLTVAFFQFCLALLAMPCVPTVCFCTTITFISSVKTFKLTTIALVSFLLFHIYIVCVIVCMWWGLLLVCWYNCMGCMQLRYLIRHKLDFGVLSLYALQVAFISSHIFVFFFWDYIYHICAMIVMAYIYGTQSDLSDFRVWSVLL